MERKGYSRDPLDDYQLPVSAVDTVTFQLMDREQARLDKDYKSADSIREQLEVRTTFFCVLPCVCKSCCSHRLTQEMGVIIDDKSRTWRAGPPPKEKVLDLNSAAVTAALTLHPEVWISGFGEATEAELNEVFRAEFPMVTFRMAREKLSGDSDEEDTRFGSGGLESLVMKEAGMGIFDQNGDDDGAPKKVRAPHSEVLHCSTQGRCWPIIGVHSFASCPPLQQQLGKGLGYGHVRLENAEEAKNFIYRFDGFPAVGADELKVRVSKQALQGEHDKEGSERSATGHVRKEFAGQSNVTYSHPQGSFLIGVCAVR